MISVDDTCALVAGAAVRMLREWTRSWRLSVQGFPAWLASHARTPVRRGRSREDRGVLRRSISNPRQGAPPDRRNGADGSARKKRRNAFPPNESTGNYEMSPLFFVCFVWVPVAFMALLNYDCRVCWFSHSNAGFPSAPGLPSSTYVPNSLEVK